VRLELAFCDENIASSAVGVVKIRNGPVGHGLSAVGTNEDVHEVFLTFSRVPREVYTCTCTHGKPSLSYGSFRTRA